MATLNIKNVPERLVRRLKAQATTHRRSLNLEVIACLESAVHSVPIDADALLASARAIRVTPVGATLTDELLTELKSRGRA